MSPSENLLKEALITNRKSQIAEQAVSVPMTLSDLERRDVGSIFFRWISLITLVHLPYRTIRLAE